MFLGQTSTDPSAQKKKKLANVTEDQLNTNQQVIPLTYLAGRGNVPGQFYSPAYNQKTKDVKATTGKDETSTVAHVYFCDFGLGKACGGRRPVDALFKLILDSEILWKNDAGLFRDTDPFEDITTTRGTFRIYWGTATSPQDTLVFTSRGAIPIDPSFNKRDKSTWPEDQGGGTGGEGGEPITGHYDRHPAYRNQCYAVFKNWKLGKEKEQVPQIMMELQRGVPWFSGNTYSPTDLDTLGLNSDERGVNPIGVLFDLLTDPIFGLGMAESELRRSGFEAALEAFKDFRVTVMLTSQDDAKTVIVQLLEYIDAFPRQYDELFDVGFFSHGVIDRDSLPLLTDDDLDGPPNIPPGGYVDSNTTFFVSYKDREHHYNDRPQKFDEPAIRRLVGERRDVVEDRPWLTDKNLAKRYITEFGKMQRQPKQAGEILIKREWLDNAPTVGGGTYGRVLEGDRFLFQSSKYGFETIFRLNELEWPEDKSGQAKLEVENERGEWSSIFVPPADPGVSDFIIEPIEVTNKRVFELPSGLKTASTPQVAILAQRPRAEMLGFSVYCADDNTTFNLVSEQNRFASFAKVAIAYPNSTDDLDTVTGFIVDLKGVDAEAVETQTDQQRDNNNLLIVTQRGEIMSAGQMTALGSNRFKIFPKRKLYGTSKVAHFVDDNVWLVYRDRLTPIEAAMFVPGSTRQFKLQPYTSLEALDLADVTSFSYNFINAPAVGSVFNPDLSTSAGVAADNSSDIRLVLKCDALLDQNIFLLEVRFKKIGDANWQSFTFGADSSGHNVTDFEVAPATEYLVNIRPINSYGEPGSWLDADLSILSATLSQISITGLELEGQGNDTVSTQPDFHLAWRLNSPSSSPGLGTGSPSPGLPDPLLDAYLVEIFAGEISAQQYTDGVFQSIWTAETGKVPAFIFRLVDNAKAGGPFPTITAVIRARDIFKNITSPAVLTVSNLKPGPPTNVTITPTLTGMNFGWENPPDVDLKNAELLQSSDPFDPNPAVVGKAASPSTSMTLDGVTAGQSYFWLREVDTFGNKSAAVFVGSGTPGALVGAVGISPNGGNINGPTPLTLTCATNPTAKIYYRFDNVTPTSADFLYDPAAKPQVSATGYFSAIAFLANTYGDPTKVHFDFVANGLSTPVLSPAPAAIGTPTGQEVVSIVVPNSPPAGTTIRVTTDDSEPSSSHGTLISGASGSITLNVGKTIVKAKAIAPTGYTDSVTARGEYTITQSGSGGGGSAAIPFFFPSPGSYVKASAEYFYVAAICNTPGSQERVTNDNSEPTSGANGHGKLLTGNADTAYGLLAGNKTIKAIAFLTGLDDAKGSGVFNITNGANPLSVCPNPQIFPFVPADGSLTTFHLGKTVKDFYFVFGVASGHSRLRFTTDGSAPTTSHGTLVPGNLYDQIKVSRPRGPDTLELGDATLLLKVIGYSTDGSMTPSSVAVFNIKLTE